VFFSPQTLPTESTSSTPAAGKKEVPTRARAEEAMQDGGEVLFLDGLGEVAVTVGRNGLSVQPLHPVCAPAP
jgi:hypothetical protein